MTMKTTAATTMTAKRTTTSTNYDKDSDDDDDDDNDDDNDDNDNNNGNSNNDIFHSKMVRDMGACQMFGCVVWCCNAQRFLKCS